MGSVPAAPKSVPGTARWRELREAFDRSMLRTRGSLRVRLKQREESARGVSLAQVFLCIER